MGGCSSAEESEDKILDTEVQNDLNEDLENSKKIHKLLLLGPGNSGKSTFFKQFNSCLGSGITETDRKYAEQNIYDSIIEQMKHILESCKLEHKYPIDEDIKKSVDYIEKLPRDIPINDDVALNIKKLWNNQTIKKTFDQRTYLGIVDSCPYFFNDIERIGKEDYIPSEMDVLLARSPTTGIREQRFVYDKRKFEIYDVGGQRSERSKWIHCFDRVHAVLFVCSLSCYDQMLYEDNEEFAMAEALDLWEEVVNSHYFANRRTSMIIFFNKVDLFNIKIKNANFSEWTKNIWEDEEKEYKGKDDNPEEIIDFLRELFLSQNLDPKRQIYVHITCATDKDTIKKLFHDVQHGIVVHALAKYNIY